MGNFRRGNERKRSIRDKQEEEFRGNFLHRMLLAIASLLVMIWVLPWIGVGLPIVAWCYSTTVGMKKLRLLWRRCAHSELMKWISLTIAVYNSKEHCLITWTAVFSKCSSRHSFLTGLSSKAVHCLIELEG